MATYNRGTIGTADINSARVVKDMSNDILLLDPKRTPFLVFSKKLRKEPTHNIKFSWQEDEVLGHRTAITTGEAVTLTAESESAAIEVDNIDILTVGDMVLIEDSGVIAYVSDVEDTATNKIKIVPGFDSSNTATDITGGEELQIIGNANEEGAGIRDENRRAVEDKSNYVQQFKTNFSMTDIQMATKTYSNKSEWGRLRYKKGIQHNEEIERALLFGGQKKLTSSVIGGSHSTTTTKGAFQFIESNVETVGSSTALTETAWNEFLKDKAFDHGSDKKTLLASKTLAHQISTWASDSVRIEPGRNKRFGVNVDSYISTLGYELDVIVHPFLEGNKYGQAGMVLDMDAIKLRTLKGNGKDFDTKLLVDVVNDGAHKQIDEYFTVAGLQLEQEKRHAAIFNTLDNS